jgi:hypothetical protein
MQRPDLAHHISALTVTVHDACGYLSEDLKWVIAIGMTRFQGTDNIFGRIDMRRAWVPTWVGVLLAFTPRLQHLEISGGGPTMAYCRLLQGRHHLRSLKVTKSVCFDWSELSNVRTLDVGGIDEFPWTNEGRSLPAVETLIAECSRSCLSLAYEIRLVKFLRHVPFIKRLQVKFDKQKAIISLPRLPVDRGLTFNHIVQEMAAVFDTLEELDLA